MSGGPVRPRVIGIGNPDRGDDAFGLLAAAALRARLGGDLVAISRGDALGLLELWQGRDPVVVVDALVSGRAPGTVRRLDARDRLGLPRFATSTHALGLAEALALARALDALPRRLTVFGVEVASLEPGAPLSPPVAAALAPVVDAVLAELAGARAGGAPD